MRRWSQPGPEPWFIAVLVALTIAGLLGVLSIRSQPVQEPPVVERPPIDSPSGVDGSPETLSNTEKSTKGEAGDSVTESEAEIWIHVAGAVEAPGVYRLPPGARLHQAVAAAGGAVESEALDWLNLARPLVDGERVYVFSREDLAQAKAVAAEPVDPLTTLKGEKTEGIDLNRADAKTLESLPGIGPVYAERLIAYRNTHGPFSSLDDITAVSGIGPSIVEKIRPYVSSP